MRSQLQMETSSTRWRLRFVALFVIAAFLIVGIQLIRLASVGAKSNSVRLSMITPSSGQTLARPDILDRKGRLLATDVLMPSLYADPSLIQDSDETAEQLNKVLPQKDLRDLRRKIGRAHV